MKICIFGGTFNPVHNGHLIMAQMAFDKFRLDKMLFIPCYLPPHKGSREIAPAQDRMEMLRRAIKGNPHFSISDIEIKRGGRSYSIDTIKGLKNSSKPTDRYYFLIGSDSLRDFYSWVEADELLKLCEFIVVERPGLSVAQIFRKSPRKKKYFTKIVSEFPVGISSTDIRRRVRSGKSIRFLVPDRVEKYIEQKGLYRR